MVADWAEQFERRGIRVTVGVSTEEAVAVFRDYGRSGALVYNAVLASGLAWLMWSYVVERLPANVAGLSGLVIPIAGIGFAWMLMGEQPSPLEGFGIALIVAALAIVSLRPGPAKAS